MKAAKYRNAWIWLAVAALSIAVAAQTQAGAQRGRAYATPVIKFLAAHAVDQPGAASAVQRLLHRRRSQADRQGSESGAWAAMLPVFFVGLVSPLNLLSPQALDSSSWVPAAPALPSTFQRPPPQLL
jgi:hypothetical protein